MAAARFTPDVRIIRPLRDIPPQRLRATLDAEGLAWIEDPSNRNAQFRRVAIRQSLSKPDIDLASTETRRYAALRQAAETSLAAYCGQLIPHPFGFVRIDGELPPPEILSRIFQAVSGADWAPSQRRLVQLRTAAQDATLGGVWFFQRRSAGVTQCWCLVREPDAAAQIIDIEDVALAESLIWDRRWRLQGRPCRVSPSDASAGPRCNSRRGTCPHAASWHCPPSGAMINSSPSLISGSAGMRRWRNFVSWRGGAHQLRMRPYGATHRPKPRVHAYKQDDQGPMMG